ncbi:MAG: LysR substrate-binding domain-containing protein [bacterium]|nr:LysR substrate-binding domain-containing protein [bacterium]
MNYTLHQLRVFLKVAEFQSVTKAAEELYLTQPAVSIQLKKLQDQFDLPLTEIVGRQLYVTDFGREIAERSRRILEEADAIKYTADRYKGLISGKIKISVVSTGKYVMPYILKPFMDKFPGVDISLDVSNKTRVVQGMIKNESDFSLVSVVPDGIAMNSIELMENRLYLTGSKIFEGKFKKPSDLKDATLLFREEGSATRAAMENYLKQHDINPKKSMELVSNEAVKQAVNAGIGLSIVPLIGLRSSLINEDIRIFPMAGLPIVTKWNLVYSKGKKLTPAQQALVDFIQEEKKTIEEEKFGWVLDIH